MDRRHHTRVIKIRGQNVYMKDGVVLAPTILLACQDRKKTMTDLARHLDITPQTVYYWNQGRTMPTFIDILRVCVFLKCTPAELYTIKIIPPEC